MKNFLNYPASFFFFFLRKNRGEILLELQKQLLCEQETKKKSPGGISSELPGKLPATFRIVFIELFSMVVLYFELITSKIRKKLMGSCSNIRK